MPGEGKRRHFFQSLDKFHCGHGRDPVHGICKHLLPPIAVVPIIHVNTSCIVRCDGQRSSLHEINTTMVAVAGMSRMAGGVTGSMPSPAFDLRGFLFEGQDVKWSFFTFGSIIELLELAAGVSESFPCIGPLIKAFLVVLQFILEKFKDSNEATSARARLQKEKVEFDRQFNDFWCSLSSAEKKMHDGILRKFLTFSKEVNSLLHMPQPHGWSCGTTKDRFREALSQLKDVKMDFAATQNSVLLQQMRRAMKDLQDQFASVADTFQIVTAGLHPEQAELVREMSKLTKIFVRGHDTAYEQ